MYKPSRQMDNFFIAGFKYHEGAFKLDKLAPGKKLKLVAEFDNPYDPNAIAIYYKKTMLGYVPRERNGYIAQLLRFGHSDVLECYVLQVNKKAETYKQVRVGIFVTNKKKK